MIYSIHNSVGGWGNVEIHTHIHTDGDTRTIYLVHILGMTKHYR